ncbi:MAG: SDR family oxidoreductase [Chloroflexota bacterium]|nr:SDR family oxidoreductase [Chloroflexota bacterium]MDE2895878.1 SDR family oxidoreductase [Chloroflexota bacterium]
MATLRIALTGADQPDGAAIATELERHDVEVVPVDAGSAKQLGAILGGMTHVVHAYSVIEPGLSGAVYNEANVHSTTALLDACRQSNVEQVLFLSTTETYGRRLPPWPVTESWVPRPLGPALQSRVAAERVARTYRRRVPLSILRPAPVIVDGGGTIMRVIRHFISRPRAALVGGGQAPISVLAAADLGRAVWAMISQPEEAVDQVFHVASAHTTWRDLAIEACHLRGIEERFWNAPYALARGLDACRLSGWVLPEPEGVDAYVSMTGRPHLIDDSRARVSLGYAPVLGVRAALAQALDLYQRSSNEVSGGDS